MASPYSPFKFSSKKEVSIEKSNHSKLSSINRKSLELSDLKDGKVYKKSDISFKIYKKPPKTPILKANMKVWKEYEKSEFIFPK